MEEGLDFGMLSGIIIDTVKDTGHMGGIFDMDNMFSSISHWRYLIILSPDEGTLS